MTPALVLAIFPGIDLLGRAFEEHGFCVVRGPDVIWGGDIRTFHPPAGRFDGVIGGDPCQSHSILVHLVRHNGNEPRFPDMTPEYERVICEAGPRWFLRENVPGAPNLHIDGYDIWSELVVDADVGGVQPRERRIWFGLRSGLWPEPLRSPFSLLEFKPCAATDHILAGPGADLARLSASTSAARRRQSLVADARAVPVKLGAGGKPKRTVIGDARTASSGARVRGEAAGGVLPIEDACEAMGLPRDFTAHMPFTMGGKRSVLGNGVPMAMGRALARMVLAAMEETA